MNLAHSPFHLDLLSSRNARTTAFSNPRLKVEWHGQTCLPVRHERSHGLCCACPCYPPPSRTVPCLVTHSAQQKSRATHRVARPANACFCLRTYMRGLPGQPSGSLWCLLGENQDDHVAFNIMFLIYALIRGLSNDFCRILSSSSVRAGGPPRFEVGETMIHAAISASVASSSPHLQRRWGTRLLGAIIPLGKIF